MTQKRQQNYPMFVDLAKVNPSIVMDLVYATYNNFCREVLYPKPLCFLHQEVAQQLSLVESDLEEIGLKLKVFDGYRPLSVQKIMWDIILDERYCSNPAKSKGRHTRGTAVDVTLVTTAGIELEMPTPFDDFSEKAHSDYKELSQKVLEHRHLLKESMAKHGFIQLPSEWWHFDYQGWEDDEKFPPFDLTFEEIEKHLNKQQKIPLRS